jgi:hypothetical protein
VSVVRSFPVRMVAHRWVDFALFVATTAKIALIAKQETDLCSHIPSSTIVDILELIITCTPFACSPTHVVT